MNDRIDENLSNLTIEHIDGSFKIYVNGKWIKVNEVRIAPMKPKVPKKETVSLIEFMEGKK